ncbi:MAG TPA: hypothetical protein VI387_00205 [Candidatus Brocadiales bacterium]|nr:hypothetical protein [Candidatus Brocadiales bacterium]
MKTKEIKSLLHESIENIDDEDFLLAMKQILERKYASSEEPKLAKWQIKRIEEAKKQIKKGTYLTNEQADKLVDKWLNE